MVVGLNLGPSEREEKNQKQESKMGGKSCLLVVMNGGIGFRTKYKCVLVIFMCVVESVTMGFCFEQVFIPFGSLQVKEGMQMAPILRTQLSEDQLSHIDNYISGKQLDPSQTYLEILKSGSYMKGQSERTFPLEEKKEEEDDIEVIGKLITLSYVLIVLEDTLELTIGKERLPD